MAAARSIVVGVLTFIVILHMTIGHPQCLDFRPPFTTRGSELFCSQYSDFGCCTPSDHDRLRQRRDEVRELMGDSWDTCGKYIEELLCQKCSPYAAHIYDAESTLEPRQFPGLCRNYCEPLYDTCRDVLHYIDPELPNKPSFPLKYDFCHDVAIPFDNDYCFPELLSNPIFKDELNNTQITGEGCLCLEEELSLMRNPIVARHAGDRSGRLFIGEQLGYVHIYFPRNKTGLSTPFLDITQRVKTSSRRGDERGFFSIAFHPNYAHNGRFFVYYSTNLQDNDPINVYGDDISIDHKIRISEIHVSRYNPNLADPDTERILLEVMEPFWNHNGGELLFGDDNYLYLFVGDGGGAGDLHGFAQNKSVHLGKILRIDVDTPNPRRPYSIPPDNPFLNESQALPEIYAYGVRNIWRCGKDRGDRHTGEGKGRIVCGDVGQSAWEEIDLVKKGANYGWKSREGFQCYDEATCGQIGEEELPIYAYPHSQGKSVTGGVFYRGCESPNLNGQYIFADYMNGRMFSLIQDENGTWRDKEVFMCGTDVCLNGLIGQYNRYVISFGEDEEGEIYLLSTGIESTTATGGKVYKLVDPARRGDPSECLHAHKGDRVDIDDLNITSGSTSFTSIPTGDTYSVSISHTTVNSGQSTQSDVSRAPIIRSMNIRTCVMASTFMCVLMSIRHR